MFFLSINSFAQTSFYNGFEEGYKAGYCYGKKACVAPMIPAAPPTGFSFQDGYNSGFQMGLDKQRGVEYVGNKGYKGTPATFIGDAMFKLPYELMMKIIDKKDQEFEDQYGTFENRNLIFKNLLVKGLDAFNRKDYESAINYCNQAQNTQLTNPMVDMILGGSYYSKGDYDSALKYLKNAKKNGYSQADKYIDQLKDKEKKMIYERPIKFGAKFGYNSNSLKPSPLLGLFFQGRTGKWGIKSFSILSELQFFQSQYNQEIDNYFYPNGKEVIEHKDNILQFNFLFKNSLTKNFAIVYGTGLSTGLESQSTMIDLNIGLQCHFSQYLFADIRYNRNIARSYFQGDGTLVYIPNNFQIALGYKF